MGPATFLRIGIACSVMLLSIALWVAGPAGSQTPTGPATSEQLGHVRIERTIALRKPWQAHFSGAVVLSPDLLRKQVQTPQSTTEVDVTLTATLDVETGRDRVSLDAYYIEENTPNSEVMEPGSFLLKHRPPRSTTSLTWAATGIPAEGRTYEFVLRASVLDGKDRGVTATATGKRLTVVIEMWPAGR